ncbi:MAG: BTAD domain-containing putative transcriptional regulator [Microlunatus sp.]
MSDPSVRVLSTVSVSDTSGELALGPGRQRAVLAVLLLSIGQPVPASDLVGRIWGDDVPPAAGQALRSYVCRLRKLVARSPAVRLVRREAGYLAVVEDGQLDLAVFRGLVNRGRVAGRDGRHSDAIAAFEQALALAPGDLLVGVGSEWLDRQRALLERERLAAAVERNDLAIATGLPEVAASDALARLVDEPYDERLAGQAVLGLAGIGRTAEALDVYAQTRKRLSEELGIEPGPALQDIQRRVLRGVRAGPAAPGVPAPRPVPRQLPPAARGFVDRVRECQALDQLLLPGADEPATVVVCGPGGAGKSTLAVRWAQQRAGAFPDGQLFVDLHGFDPDCRPTAPETALRGLLGALGIDPATLPNDFASMLGAYRTVLADRRVLLVADDVGSAEQVRPLLPPGRGSAALLTSRSGLPGLATAVGAQVLTVGMLDRAAARELLIRRLGQARTDAEPEAVDRLLALCGGLALALAIVAGRAAAIESLSLTALADELADESRQLAALSGGERRTSLDAVVAASVATLSPPARSVLEWLATAPRVCVNHRLVAALACFSTGAAEDAVRELLAAHLLEPDGGCRYRLHDLVRLALRSRPTPDLEQAVSRLQSFLISEARALESRAAGTGDDRVSLDQLAVDLLSTAAYADATGDDVGQCMLADALERPLGSTGRWSELVAVNDRAVAAARRLGDRQRLAAALIGRGRGAIGTGDHAGAATDLSAAMVAADATDDLGLQARAHRALARLAAHQQRWDDALRHDEYGLALHRRRGDSLGEAHAHNAVGWHLAHLGRAEESLARCRLGLAIFVEHDDRAGQALTQDSIGFAMAELGRDGESRTAYRHAATLCRELGWQVLLPATLLRLAGVAERIGDHEEAAAARAEADAIGSTNGEQESHPERIRSGLGPA